MKANKMTMCGVFAAMAAGAFASDGESSKIAWTPGEGVAFGETPVVSAEFSLGFDSRYMTYGVIDGKDPIVVPGASITFFDWVYFGVEAIYDVTKGNGKRGGYGNRAENTRRSTRWSALRTISTSANLSGRSALISATCTSICRVMKMKWATRSI
jgi:hypothetical protein